MGYFSKSGRRLSEQRRSGQRPIGQGALSDADRLGKLDRKLESFHRREMDRERMAPAKQLTQKLMSRGK